MKLRTLTIATFALLLAVTAFAADVTGKWTGEVPGRNGQARPVTFTLKASGSALTGTVGSQQGEIPITDGKIDGNNLSFSVTREMQGNSIKINYTGTVSGDEIKMKQQRDGAEGRVQEFTAKRAS
jgi:hypothetical protein